MKRSLRVVIASGPTREPIDPVRFLSNYSTGYIGAQLAAEALDRGHRVSVVTGPGTEPLPRGARVIPVEQAHEMERALRREAPSADVIIMAAAVADYRPVRRAFTKLRRKARLTLQLQATPDIIARLPRRQDQLVVGFALETDRVLQRAAHKLRTKRLDVLLAQHACLHRSGQAKRTRSPFGRAPVRAWLLERGSSPTSLGRIAKPAVARALLDKIESLWYGQRRLATLHTTRDA